MITTSLKAFEYGEDKTSNFIHSSGKPSGARRGNCRVYIQGGSNCLRSGNQIWDDYQQIHAGNCEKCGSKHWGDGCLTSIDYIN